MDIEREFLDSEIEKSITAEGQALFAELASLPREYWSEPERGWLRRLLHRINEHDRGVFTVNGHQIYWNGREMREEKLIQTTTGPAYIDIPPTIRVPWFRGIVWQAWLVGIGLYAAAGFMLYAIFVRPWLR